MLPLSDPLVRLHDCPDHPRPGNRHYTQGKPARVASLASWMRALLQHHAAYLLACPGLLPMLTPLYQLIDERLAAFKPLAKLVGRMQMLQSQLVAQQAASQREGAALAPSDPVLTFDEVAEEEEAARAEAGGENGDEDEDDGEEEDDDEDDEEEDDDDEMEEDDDFGLDDDDF